MADATQMVSYDLNGKKLSFANWISNLSPTETPFVSMTGKESINQTLFQWQTDVLETAVADNAVIEGSAAEDHKRKSTTVLKNITQILRKVVKVSDTANVLANYGRGKELQYQMEKAGKEIKRDLEMALLRNGLAIEEDKAASGKGRSTAGYAGLVGGVPASGDITKGNTPDPDTKAVVVKTSAKADTFTEEELFELTYNLYIAGSNANIIMFHPKHAKIFSSLMETSAAGGTRERMFDGASDTRVNTYVSTIVDPLGQNYKLIPNRWMPEDAIYVFTPSDWTQMVLRAPERTKLAKDGSYEKWMIEMEVGLRHRNPYASGILSLKAAGGGA